ncbi:stage II sporulation protein GA (sporulation sigma-E factor processing peptidase) [Sporobacter termitidis DSM 10068]|uniref:Sporulation sigma-E factor-processing peptidase n=1 Tax=Sporobacter termitidis DSM 10068 TaxID=1123282 RepID=A0A1M5Y653_9FIRM|nr:sigma-E processing peptidase SpoIIGA [Sporobacter termitidis]SHI07308.1 stage II sporulation protein GA (sporulation sigma-E factor processing peptidase) [Sporobacter termitidis DSM 10068]
MIMQVVYVDSLFLINIVINYILLLVTAKICAVKTPRLRLLGGAALGAFYAVAAVLPLTVFLTSLLVKVAVGIVMVLCAFGGQARIIRLTLVFFAVSAAFGGAVMAVSLLGGGNINEVHLSVSLKLLILAFGGGYIVLTLVFRRAAKHRGGGIVTLELRHGGRKVSMRALRDTGNSLTDPMTGRPVIVAGVGDLKPLFAPDILKTVTELRKKDVVHVLEELSVSDKGMRFQLVPYSAVGVTGGMLLAFRPDEIVVDGRNKTGMLLALSPNSVSENGAYSALLGA